MYRDVANKPTIGIGHLLTAKELSTGTVRIGADDVPWADGLSDVQIDALLDQDLLWARRVVSEAITVPLTQHEFDALVSFTFNVGPGHFRSSTLVKKLNAGDYQAVPDQLRRWVYAGGKEVQGLKNRREMEIRLWRTVT